MIPELAEAGIYSFKIEGRMKQAEYAPHIFVLSQGDLMGCVMLLMGDDTTPLPEAEQKLVQTVAGFLGKQMES